MAKKQKLERHSTYNIEGSTINLLMCKIENEALMAAFDYITSQNIEVSCLVFDGLMVYKDDVVDIDKLLRGCSDAVYEKLNGCKIEFTVKEMDEGFEINTPPQSLSSDIDILRKGVYPYEYIDSFEKFNETELPPMKSFTAVSMMKA